MESKRKFKVNDIVTLREGHLKGIQFKVTEYDNYGRVEAKAESADGDCTCNLSLYEDKFILFQKKNVSSSPFKPRSHEEIYGDKVAPMSRQEKMEIWERFWAEKGLMQC